MKKMFLLVISIFSILLLCNSCDGWPFSDGEEQYLPGVDSDGDGLEDLLEAGGFTISVDTNGDGIKQDRIVTSDPSKADTDGDGLNDALERANSSDPNFRDTDGDLLSDYEEVVIYGTNANAVDSDLDGDGDTSMFDGREAAEHGTSPKDWDTDGDGISDRIELNSAIRNKALIANLPELTFTFSSQPNITANYNLTVSNNTQATTSSLQLESMSSSQTSYESKKVIDSREANASTHFEKNFPGRAKLEVDADVSISKQTTTFNSDSWAYSQSSESQDFLENVNSTESSISYT